MFLGQNLHYRPALTMTLAIAAHLGRWCKVRCSLEAIHNFADGPKGDNQWCGECDGWGHSIVLDPRATARRPCLPDTPLGFLNLLIADRLLLKRRGVVELAMAGEYAQRFLADGR